MRGLPRAADPGAPSGCLTSSARSNPNSRASSGRSRSLPETRSLMIRAQPAARRASSCGARSYPAVDTRAQPIVSPRRGAGLVPTARFTADRPAA